MPEDKINGPDLNVAVAAAEVALSEAAKYRMGHLVGIVNRKLIIFPVEYLRVLTEAGWHVLEERGVASGE